MPNSFTRNDAGRCGGSFIGPALAAALLILCIQFHGTTSAAQSELKSNHAADQVSTTYAVHGRIVDALTMQPVPGVRFVYGQVSNTSRDGGFSSFSIEPSDTNVDF